VGEEYANGWLKVAAITGEHPFDVSGFQRFLHAMPTLDCDVVDLDNLAWDLGAVRDQYDVLLFYNFHWATPGDEVGWWQRKRAGLLEALGETPQGIFVLHHALAAFPQWPRWSEIVGIPHESRTYPPDIGHVVAQMRFNQTFRIEVVDPAHPVTQGLADWDLTGEAWGDLLDDPDPNCHILLQTRHPDMRLTAMAWTRQFGQARVFCLHPGHDAATWDNPQFRTVVERACHWLAPVQPDSPVGSSDES
jgi:hypothetical protein